MSSSLLACFHTDAAYRFPPPDVLAAKCRSMESCLEEIFLRKAWRCLRLPITVCAFRYIANVTKTTGEAERAEVRLYIQYVTHRLDHGFFFRVAGLTYQAHFSKFSDEHLKTVTNTLTELFCSKGLKVLYERVEHA